jgi:hypothetical protein
LVAFLGSMSCKPSGLHDAPGLPDTADLKVCTTPARSRHGTGDQELRRTLS